MKYLYKIVLMYFICITSVSADDIVILERVNNWVNRNIVYTSDIQLYNNIDYWATPKETLKYLKGDCEDFAILKYFLLIEYGIDKSNLFFMYARLSTFSLVQSHVVLVYKNKTELVLDNTRYTIDELKSRDDLTYRFFFNPSENPPKKLKKVLDKMQIESVELK